jgi:ankyrin repeat protein
MFRCFLLLLILATAGLAIGQVPDNPCRGADCKLLDAALIGNLPEVRTLVRSGANINARGKSGTTPLLEAIASKKTEVATFLIASGADVNLFGAGGTTPLMAAAFYGERKIVVELLAHQVDPNSATNSGYTALMNAAMNCAECIGVLLAHGAVLDAADSRGRTALTEAAFAGNFNAVKLLVKAGANVEHKTAEGLTALQVARNRLKQGREEHIPLDGQHRKVIQFLQRIM